MKLLMSPARITTPKTQNREIVFTESGFENDPEFTSWDFREERGQQVLFLKNQTGVIAKLRFHQDHWEGHDIRGGKTVLRFENIHEWRKVFVRQPQNIKKPEDVFLDQKTGVIDYSKYDYRLSDRFQREKDNAIAVIGCNRPNYFKQVVDSLIANNLENYDVYVFVDTPLRDHENPLRDIVSDYAKNLTNRITVHPINFGCGRTIIDARTQVFNMGYDKMFVFEDDLVVSKHYVGFCERLFDWGQQFGNVGAVQGWNKCLLSADEKKKRLKEVFVTYTNWWGYLISREAWKSIEPFMHEYRDRFLYNAYHNRPIRSILQWFKPLAEKNFSTKATGFHPDSQTLEHRRNLFNSIPSGQDAATWVSFDSEGWVRLAPTVNRALYIGKEGIHMSPSMFHQHQFTKVQMEDYLSDSRLKNFEARK